MKAYWWRGSPGERINNFGDELNTFILSKLGRTHDWATPADAELVMSGSILEQLPSYWTGTVCGAGKFHENSKIHLSDVRVFALRGKLTQAGVVGLGGQKPVLGDPGLLASMFVRQPSAKYDLGVVPHWTDNELRGRFAYGHYIDPRQPVEKVIEQIAACKRVISSSLHGVIIADAYGIPRQAELPPLRWKAEVEGGDFKWRDYASVLDGDPHWGEMWQAPRETVQAIQRDLYAALLVATGIDPSRENSRHPEVSLLVPFRDDGQHRGVVWNWLREYWRAEYPEAEIIQGHDDGSPFSKAVAVNHAASLARGRIFLVIDADTYMPVAQVRDCVDKIATALNKKKRAWFVPYTMHYRLSESYTMGLLKTPPTQPIPLPPNTDDVEAASVGTQWYGHEFGAFAQLMPREAFGLVHGMDPAFRGWGCCDEKTEILTTTGWMNYRDVNVGDQVLTLNHQTGLSEWNSVRKMNVYDGTHEMLSIESKTHSSLTTLNHRWPVERYWSVKQVGKKAFQRSRRDWATSEKFQCQDYVPIAAECADLPSEPKYIDALVQVVGWFWTEGSIDRLRDGRLGRSVTISQSIVVNPDKCDLIAGALTRAFGPASDFPRRGKSTAADIPRWYSSVSGRNVVFSLNAEAGELVQSAAPGRVPAHEFLLSLTQAQLALFIEASMLADGHLRQRFYERVLTQKNSAAADAFQFACILAGHPTASSSYKIDPKYGYDMSTVSIRQQRRFKLAKGRHERVTYTGVVWCPTTANSTWLARRNGKVYFTGNSEDSSFMNSLDTLYAQHHVADGSVAHLWHAKIGADVQSRQWVGQQWSATNSRLAQRYTQAVGEPAAMRGLADEHPLGWASDLVLSADGDSI